MFTYMYYILGHVLFFIITRKENKKLLLKFKHDHYSRNAVMSKSKVKQKIAIYSKTLYRKLCSEQGIT